MTPRTTLASVLTRFFTQRLIQQQQVSSHTVHSYLRIPDQRDRSFRRNVTGYSGAT